MRIEDLKIGKIYKVTIDDCCVQGYFVSKLINKIAPKTEFDSTEYHFENGVVFTELFLQKCLRKMLLRS